MDKNFLVYKASAGSGKTFNLARIFIEELIRKDERTIDAHLKSIMAITFTHKAANEMKDRVLTFLERMSIAATEDDTANALIEDISKNIQLSKEEVIKRSGLALEMIIENFSYLSISTIDSFSHRVVRSFSKELNLHYDFDVSLDYKSWIELAIDRLFDRFGSDSKDDKVLSETLIHFFISQFEQGSNWNLKWLLNDFAFKNFNDDLHDVYKKYPDLSSFNLQHISNKLKKEINEFTDRIAEIAMKALSLINEQGLTGDEFYYKARGVFGFFTAASLGENKFDLPNSYVIKTLEEDKWEAGKNEASISDSISSIKDELGQLLSELVAIKMRSQDLRVNELILNQIHIMALISFIVKELNLIREEENLLLISDFNLLIDGVVKNEPVPFIYEKLGERYRHFLLDEFQDTSIKQWHNFVPLFDNALAGNNRSLIVGDGKQAIYRFRGGEVELFSDLPKIYKAEGELFNLYEQNLSREIKRINLENNFRSFKELVKFNNTFFSNIKLVLTDFAIVYENLEQTPVKKADGYVKFEILESKELKENDLYLEKTLESILECVSDNYDYGDIAVLARTKDNLKSIAAYLSENGVDVVSDESLTLKNQENISVLISVMKYLLQPEDLESRYALFRALIYKYEADSYADLELIKSNSIPVEKKLKELDIKLNHESLRSLSLLELAKEIENIFSLDVTTDAYYNTFLDIIEDYIRANGNQLDGFIDYWNEIDPSISTPDNSKAVKLLTIHKSKGLEYPIVIIPYLDWKKRLTQNYQWISPPENLIEEIPKILLKLTTSLEETSLKKNYDWEKNKSLLDDINLIYVAFTRAKERLYVFTSDQNGTGNISNEVLLAVKMMGIEDARILEKGKREKKVRKDIESTSRFFNLQSSIRKTRNSDLKIAYEFLKYSSEKSKKALSYGNAIHQLFSKIYTKDDIQKALDSSLKEGLFNKEEIIGLNDKIDRILSLDPVEKWFSKEGNKYLERELVNADGKLLRPDRIVIDNEKVSVIDYKTGVLNDAKMLKYKTQVNEYIDAFKAMDYKNIKGYIIAIDEEKVILI